MNSQSQNLGTNRCRSEANLVRLTVEGDGKVLHKNITENNWNTILSLDTKAVLIRGISIVVQVVEQILGSSDGESLSAFGSKRQVGEVIDISLSHGDTLTLEEAAAIANTRQVDGAAHRCELLLEGLHDTIGNNQQCSSRINDDLIGVELRRRDTEGFSADGDIGQIDAVVLLLGDLGPLVSRVLGDISAQSNRGAVGDEAHGERVVKIVGLLDVIKDGRSSPRRDRRITDRKNRIATPRNVREREKIQCRFAATYARPIRPSTEVGSKD